MLVITLTDCPPALKGDLSKWLQEIYTSVYVGQVSARVRDELWARVKANVKSGRATMVFSAANEQRMDFRVHNGSWEPIDFDGLKLMLRPNTARLRTRYEARTGYSKAAKFHMAKQMMARQASVKQPQPENFAVIEVETTGLSAEDHEMVKICALKTTDAETSTAYQAFIRPSTPLPPAFAERTGITARQLMQEGRPLAEVLPEFLAFVGELPVVTHNARLDMAFLRAACVRCGLPLFANRCVDTLAMARRYVKEADDYKLKTLADHLHLFCNGAYDNRDDCLITMRLYGKLIEISKTTK